MGEYATEPHTYEHFKEELWFPDSDRFSYGRARRRPDPEKAEQARSPIETILPNPWKKQSGKIDQIVKKACS